MKSFTQHRYESIYWINLKPKKKEFSQTTQGMEDFFFTFPQNAVKSKERSFSKKLMPQNEGKLSITVLISRIHSHFTI